MKFNRYHADRQLEYHSFQLYFSPFRSSSILCADFETRSSPKQTLLVDCAEKLMHVRNEAFEKFAENNFQKN